ncbi:MAG: PAS domain-containing protein [Thermodesulfovibrionales bacterium]
MFKDRLIYRLFIMLLIFSTLLMLSVYALTHNEIGKIKSGADILVIERHIIDQFISLSFYTFFLSFLLSIFLSQNILNPVRELYKGALSIRDGNLTIIPEVRTYDELREVIHAFNDMSVTLKEKTEELERTNREIKSAKDFLETVMDSIMDKIAIINREMKVVKANKAALIKYSENPEDILNIPCYSVFHKGSERCEVDDCPARKVFEYGKTCQVVHAHTNESGDKSYCEIIASPIFDHDGNVIYMIEVLRDITERVKYDEELKRKNRELSALNSIAELLSRALTDKGAIREAIFRLLDMLGMDDGGIFLIDEKTDELVCYFTDRRLPCDDNIPSYVIKTGNIYVSSDLSANKKEIPCWLDGLGIKSYCCVPLKGRDKVLGTLYLFSTEPREFNEEEKTILRSTGDMLGIAIEGIKLYEELKNLRITEKGLAEMVFNSISEGLYTVDNNYAITSVNKAAEEILGLSATELIGQRCYDVIGHRETGSDNKLCDRPCPISKALDQRSTTMDADYIRPDGKRMSLRISCSPLKDSSGNVIGAVEVFSDVTKEREIDRMKTEFVKTVSHEFRTPLSAIVGMTEMLLEDEVSGERAKEYLDTIMNEGERLAIMVTELLDISRIESGEWVLHKSEIDFNLLMHEIKKTLSMMLERKKIQLETSIANDVKCFKGDKEKLKQLLINLITNSINYSDDGSMVDINIRKEEGKLLIKVSDTGWGILAYDIPHLTKKFYRGRHGIKTKGTGLGLALCKEIAKLHGGDISIVSRLGEGTAVTVEMPFEGDCDE